AIERLLQPTATEERINLQGLSFDGLLNGGIVQKGERVLCAEAREGGLELERFVQGLLHKLLDDRLPPRGQNPVAKAASKALHAGKADSHHLAGFAVEHLHSRGGKNLGDFLLTARLIIV